MTSVLRLATLPAFITTFALAGEAAADPVPDAVNAPGRAGAAAEAVLNPGGVPCPEGSPSDPQPPAQAGMPARTLEHAARIMNLPDWTAIDCAHGSTAPELSKGTAGLARTPTAEHFCANPYNAVCGDDWNGAVGGVLPVDASKRPGNRWGVRETRIQAERNRIVSETVRETAAELSRQLAALPAHLRLTRRGSVNACRSAFTAYEAEREGAESHLDPWRIVYKRILAEKIAANAAAGHARVKKVYANLRARLIAAVRANPRLSSDEKSAFETRLNSVILVDPALVLRGNVQGFGPDWLMGDPGSLSRDVQCGPDLMNTNGFLRSTDNPPRIVICPGALAAMPDGASDETIEDGLFHIMSHELAHTIDSSGDRITAGGSRLNVNEIYSGYKDCAAPDAGLDAGNSETVQELNADYWARRAISGMAAGQMGASEPGVQHWEVSDALRSISSSLGWLCESSRSAADAQVRDSHPRKIWRINQFARDSELHSLICPGTSNSTLANAACELSERPRPERRRRRRHRSEH